MIIMIIIIIIVIIIMYVSFKYITMQNLEVVASKLAKLWPFNDFSKIISHSCPKLLQTMTYTIRWSWIKIEIEFALNLNSIKWP